LYGVGDAVSVSIQEAPNIRRTKTMLIDDLETHRSRDPIANVNEPPLGLRGINGYHCGNIRT